MIGNLRPIALSNTDHKLITKTYSKKFTNLVGKLTGHEQTAYILNMLINDNVPAILMTTDLANVDMEVDSMIVSMDEKSFESVDHTQVRKKSLTALDLACFIPIFDVLFS